MQHRQQQLAWRVGCVASSFTRGYGLCRQQRFERVWAVSPAASREGVAQRNSSSTTIPAAQLSQSTAVGAVDSDSLSLASGATSDPSVGNRGRNVEGAACPISAPTDPALATVRNWLRPPKVFSPPTKRDSRTESVLLVFKQ